MQPSGERIYYLLRSYTNGTATEAEEKELYEWVAETPDSTEVKSHIKQLIHKHQRDKFTEVDWERVYQQIWQNTHKDTTFHVVRKRHWFRAVAVILVLILAGGGIYLFSVKKKQTPAIVENTTKPYKNDIKPGSTKAILQAGNNQVVLTKKDTSFTLAGNTVHINSGDVKITDVKPVQYTLITPRGGEYRLVLSDGTKVWLNADSKLVYPSVFTGNNRKVTLSGEAYFEVKTDSDHPFVVKLSPSSSGKGRGEIKVLGTAFNISSYPNDKKAITTLVRGKVNVKYKKKLLQLEPGQQAVLNENRDLILNKNVDTSLVIAWKNGNFRFKQADIHFIMTRLARWYDIKVKYEGEAPTQHFGAILTRDNNISEMVKILEATGEVHFKIEGKEVTVTR